MNVQHFLITRYNLLLYDEHPRSGWRSRMRCGPEQADEWMKFRLELFGRFCAPTVAAQTCADFTWLVLCDVRTPKPELDSIAALLPANAIIRTILRSEESERDALTQHLDRNRRRLLTTRLDSDDAIHETLMARIRDAVERRAPLLIDPVWHYEYDWTRRRLYQRRHVRPRGVGYCGSLWEKMPRRGPAVTVCRHAHNHMGRVGPIKRIETLPPLLIHTRHRDNLDRSQARGQPVAEHPEGFAVQWTTSASA